MVEYDRILCICQLASCHWYWMLSLALYEQIKYSYVPETRIGRIYATQNDNKNDNRINPKTNFKHHHALIMETEQVISQ